MNLGIERFSPLVNSPFTIHTQAGPIEVTLFSATQLPRGERPEALPTPLSLIFTSPTDVQFRQDNFGFEHPSLGEGQHVWCMVPIMPPREVRNGGVEPRNYYQVLFN